MSRGSLEDATEGNDSVVVIQKLFGDDRDFPGSGDLDNGDFGVAAGF